jgi:general stress protein YciG
VIGAAVKVMRIATGEEREELAQPPNPAAELGRKGGAARAKALTPEQRREIARKGAASRWGKPE